MIALYIILGIIAFFVLLLSIRVQVKSEYIDSFVLKVRWLFLTFTVYPLKKPIELKEKETKPEEPQKEEKKPEENINKKKENPFKKFYDNQGFDGVMQLVSDGADAFGKFGRSLKKHFIIDELCLWAVISKNHDAAATAIEYGRVCQKVFPVMGYICSHFKVKRYDVSVEPDFIGSISTAQFVFNFSLRPIFLINASIVMGVRLLFKVVFKVLFQKDKKSSENNNETINFKGGATQ
ncbi:MAG: DUF2953 domain-containing protein [Clostridiaceae bacterium]|nr:DUF2953 domain-containing protein [Clostridiaceae bacterium]